VGVKEIDLILEHNSVIFAHPVIKGFCQSGGFVHGVIDRDLIHQARPFLHLYAIMLDAGTAMVNLCGKQSFIDPFCGAGGILIEGFFDTLHCGDHVPGKKAHHPRRNAKDFPQGGPGCCNR